MSGQLTFFPGFSPASDKGMFDHGADVIFNTVNCRGTGAKSRGVAGQVFTRYPGAHAAYLDSCRTADASRRLKPGMILPVEVNPRSGAYEKGSGFFVMNAATKDDWRDPSRFEWVAAIGSKLDAVAERTGARRMAIPPLGCGEGGLDWKRQVGPMLRPHLEALAARGVDVLVFAEDPAPERGGAVSVRSEDNRKTSRQSALPLLDGAARSRIRTEADWWYAGVGARPHSDKNPTGTPPKVLGKMEELGEALAEQGWGLRSGGAAGADEAFETGARRFATPALQIFLPQQSFNGRAVNGNEYLLETDPAKVARVEAMARRLHPAGDRLSGFPLKAMARNSYQVMGPNLDSLSKAVVCYTHKGEEVGGTGHALRLADIHNVPVINLGDARWRSASVPDIVQAMAEVRAGGALSVPEPKRRTRDGDAR